jgi:hypothetical protein
MRFEPRLPPPSAAAELLPLLGDVQHARRELRAGR